MKPLSVLAKTADLFFATRPVILIPVWGFAALGYCRAIGGSSPFPGLCGCRDSASLSLYGEILLFSLAVAAVYLVNQIADIAVDRNNGGLPLIASGIVPLRSARLLTALCALPSLLLPLLFKKPHLSLFGAATLLLGVLYNCRPFRFSGRPVVDFLSNGIGYGIIAFGVGYQGGNGNVLAIRFLQQALPYVLLMCAGSISSTLPDRDGDRTDGKMTTAVAFGLLPAHAGATLLLLAAALVGRYNGDALVLLCALAPLPLYIGYFLKPSLFFMEATYKIGGAFCMVAAFIIMPWFALIALVVFCATWLYFRIRHETAYPSLVPLPPKR